MHADTQTYIKYMHTLLLMPLSFFLLTEILSICKMYSYLAAEATVLLFTRLLGSRKTIISHNKHS
jgi:hypothetical protein